MASRFVHRRRVEFSDTDMAGIMHFTNLIRFMEMTEHAFLRSLGHSVTLREIDPALGLPRVHVEADFLRPFHFEDEIEIELIVKARTGKSLTYGFALRRIGDPGRRIGATGTMTVVCVRRDADGVMRSCDLPPVLADRIGVHPGESRLETGSG